MERQASPSEPLPTSLDTFGSASCEQELEISAKMRTASAVIARSSVVGGPAAMAASARRPALDLLTRLGSGLVRPNPKA